jgi:UTP--glucose-1-phosphate uridylyltransferase
MKGVIIAAGYGTRFLPVTKTIPKEMLPLITKPSIDFIIEEFIQSGITEIMLVSSRRKKSLEDYLDREIELESLFEKQGNEDALRIIAPPKINIHIVRQKEMFGTGHAIMLAESFIGKESFVVAYSDDIHFGNTPLASSLIEKHRQTGCSVLATIHNPPNISRYGVLALDKDNLHVTDIVEKPPIESAPSKEVSIGRFLFTGDIFNHLREGWEKHRATSARETEYYHIYALKRLIKNKKVVYERLKGERFDIGDPAGYFRTLIRYSKTIPEFATILMEEGQN